MKLFLFLTFLSRSLALLPPSRSHRSVRIDSSQLCSMPNPLDTLTSGLASIFRVGNNGLAGVTVSPNTKKLDDSRLKLYDIENSQGCRVVRELVTEFDLVVDIVPAAPSSRNTLPVGATVPCLVVLLPNGEEKTFSGASDIADFLKQSFSEETSDMATESSMAQVVEALTPVSLFAASALRTGRGSAVTPAVTSSARVNRPDQKLILYSYEGNQFCRLVREVLTELDITYEIRSAGKGSPRRSELAELTGGSTQCPYLVDPNTETSLGESADIIRYLYKTYALWTPPSELLEWASQTVMPVFKPLFSFLAPIQAGSKQEKTEMYESEMEKTRKEIEEDVSSHPVVIYTYELSPFSYETKALLDSLNIQYREISLGKEWVPGLLAPGGALIRATLLKMTKQSSLPHVFIGGKPIGGLFSGTPGLLGLLEEDKLMKMVEEATSRNVAA